MFFSVIMTAYNEEAYIAKSLEAVTRQDFPKYEYEIILVDNNCTDRTIEIARAFPGVKIVREARQGLTRARECGRMHARGKVLAFLDADSIPPQQWLKNAYEWFQDASTVGVSGPYDHYDGHPLFRALSLSLQSWCFPICNSILHRWLRCGAIVQGGNCFARASALAAAGGFNTEIEFWGEDAEMARRLSTQGRIVFTRSVTLKSSARRYSQTGTARLVWLYWTNFVWVVLFKKPCARDSRKPSP